jgi:methionine-rich copper-binding protein CopC
MRALRLFLAGIAATTLAIMSITSFAFAHGGAEVSVSPAAASPGGEVDVHVEGYGPETTVSVTLEGVRGSVLAGTVTTDSEGDATLTVTLPADLQPGSYSLKAAGGDDSETTDLSVTATAQGGQTPTGASSPAPGEQSFTYRQPTAQWVGIAVAAMVVALAGFALVLRRE